ncbi:Nucleic-acid-binding protein, partial [Aphis craccivora]
MRYQDFILLYLFPRNLVKGAMSTHYNIVSSAIRYHFGHCVVLLSRAARGSLSRLCPLPALPLSPALLIKDKNKINNYGLTKCYCGYPARCVLYGARHTTFDGLNSRDAPPKCALSSGDHHSNYKGCSIYRDLQRQTQPVKASSTHPPAANYTYARATFNSNANNTVPPLPDINILLANFMNDTLKGPFPLLRDGSVPARYKK